jgi:tight adherence protein C
MFETLNTMITDTLGPAGPLIVIAGLAALLIIGTIPMLMNNRPDPLDRLKETGRNKLEADTRAVLREKSRNEKLNKYAQFLEPQDEKELSNIKQKLLQAGYRGKDAVQLYYFMQVTLGLLGLAAGLGYYFLFMDPVASTMQDKIMYICGPGIVGYLGPKYWIYKRSDAREHEIEAGFPA